MKALAHSLVALLVMAMAVACGSSYDPKYTIPVSSELQKHEPASEEDILDEAGLLDEDEDEEAEAEEEEAGTEETDKAPAPAAPAPPKPAPATKK